MMQLGFNDVTFLTADPCSPQGALAGVSIWERDAGGAVGAQRRGPVLGIAHRHGLGAQRSLPSKWALATADGHGQAWWKAHECCHFFSRCSCAV